MPPLVARKTWADIMSDDEDDEDCIVSQGRKAVSGHELVCEDTYQGSAHPDVEGSKSGLNLGLATVEFSDNSHSLTTPSRAKRDRTLDKEPSETEKPSPKAKVPRMDPDLDSDNSQPTWAAKLAASLKGEKKENTKGTEGEPLEPEALAASADPAVILRSREEVDASPKSPQKDSEAIDWTRRFETRQKQIQKAMDSEGYTRYKKLFPVPGPKDPRTPRADSRTERKAFDFELKVWKTFLHKFDNLPLDAVDS